jgi:SAM-dependent methyltransferase
LRSVRVPAVRLFIAAAVIVSTAMHTDIVDIRLFYGTQLGRLAERSIAMALVPIWSKLANERLVGIGYSLPWLDRLSSDAERTFAFMPAKQGAVTWPPRGPSATVLVFDEELPLPDSSVDRILMVHALEHSESPADTLQEMWRVLSPGGRLVVVVPNRRGLWARFEHTPFGTGRPFSRAQLTKVLRGANFTPTAWSDGLHFPPWHHRSLMRFSPTAERLGRRFWPIFSGAILVEAEKRLYQGLPVTERASRRVFVPVLSPQAAPRAAVKRRSGV